MIQFQKQLKFLAFVTFLLLWTGIEVRADLTSVQVQVNKSPAVFFTGRNISAGDVTITIQSDNPAYGNGLEPEITARIDLVSAPSGTTPLSNDLNVENLTLTTGDQTHNPIFYSLQSHTGNSVRFRVRVSSSGVPLSSFDAYSAALNVYDYESSSITILRSPADFYTGKNANANVGVRLTVNSTAPANGGFESWMRAYIAVVPVGGSGSVSNEVTPGPLSMTTGVKDQSPTFYPSAAHTGSAYRFQLTITSATDTTPLVCRTGTNPSYSPAINIYDFDEALIQLIRSPAEFFTGKNVNTFPSVQVTVKSTSAADSYGLEDWMRVYAAVVPVGASGSVSNQVTPSPLSWSAGTQVSNPTFYPSTPHVGSTYRFQITVTSASSTTPLAVRTGTNPTFSSAINIYDYETMSVSFLRSPADFFTGKNVNTTPGLRVTVVSTAPAAYGLESWMRIRAAVVPVGGTGSVSNEVSPNPVTGLTNGVQVQSPVFYPSSPHIGSSVRFQITLTSATSTSPLYARTGSNPVFTSAINIYDYDQSSIQIVQGPDPLHAKFTVDEIINALQNEVDLVVKSTEPTLNYGPEAHMRIRVQLLDYFFSPISGGLDQETFIPGTDFAFGSTDNYPQFEPRFASYSQTVRFRMTVSSATGTPLIPRTGVNPSTSTLVTVNAGTPVKLLMIPMDATWLRPDLVGRVTMSEADPFLWTPTALGEDLRVRAILTDRWSNAVPIPGTPLTFSATTYLQLPDCSATNACVLEDGIQGTNFYFNFDPWEVSVPITVGSPGFTSETIYIKKFGLPKDTIFVGPSPFNPMLGQQLKFGFQVDEDMDVNILVLDIFGQKVWEKSVTATANIMNTSVLWDGRNSRGERVAAGVYWAVLDKNGTWKSKKKFGVIK